MVQVAREARFFPAEGNLNDIHLPAASRELAPSRTSTARNPLPIKIGCDDEALWQSLEKNVNASQSEQASPERERVSAPPLDGAPARSSASGSRPSNAVWARAASTSAAAFFELTHRAQELLDTGLKRAADFFNRTAPQAAAYLLKSAPTPRLNPYPIRAVEWGARVLTFAGSRAAGAAVNLITFGLPSWIEGARRHYAARNGTSLFNGARSNRDFIEESAAHCITEPELQAAMREYVQLRTDLAALRRAGPFAAEQRRTLVNRILELEKAGDPLGQLAKNTAHYIIEQAAEFYPRKLGKKGSSLENGVKAREATEAKIAATLKRIYSTEMSREGVRRHLADIERNVVSHFGTHRQYLKAGFYSLLVLIPLV